ncbi:MAG: anaerobic ribonucleoside-triphosphate reductase activating protein [Candidatus Omnitrophota bacterium]
MKIGGLQKLSLIDYPGKTCAVIFTQGCNFRCSYCHNPELVYPELFAEPISFEHTYEFLKAKSGLLDGVVFSGGEPTLHGDLIERIRDIRSLGYAVKLDTNGSNPDVLSEVLPCLDYVAMDIKAPMGNKYTSICGMSVDDYDIRVSMLLIKASGIQHEFRTTFDRKLLENTDIAKIKSLAGGSKFNLQECLSLKKYPGHTT